MPLNSSHVTKTRIITMDATQRLQEELEQLATALTSTRKIVAILIPRLQEPLSLRLRLIRRHLLELL